MKQMKYKHFWKGGGALTSKSKTSKNSETKKKSRIKARKLMYIDLVFIIMPFIFLGLKDPSLQVFFDPSWSLAASILFGQTIARLVSGLAAYHKIDNREEIIIFISVLFGAGGICIISYLHVGLNPGSLEYFVWAIVQVILFLVSIASFVVFGAIGQRMLALSNK
jgi:hypothetical protein